MKNILIVVEDDVYFKLQEIKGRLQLSTWEEVLLKFLEQNPVNNEVLTPIKEG